MTPWEAEIRSARRERDARSHRDEVRVDAKAYYPTRDEARAAMREEMANRAGSWDRGEAYNFGIRGRLRHVDSVPSRHRVGPARPPPVRTTPKGYHYTRENVRIGAKEAARRLAISRTQRERWVLIRKAAGAPGTFREKERPSLDYIVEAEPDFTEYPGSIENGDEDGDEE